MLALAKPDYYKLTIDNLCWGSEKPKPTHKALAELSVLIQKEIVNIGGNGFIMPVIYIVRDRDCYRGVKEFLPSHLKDIQNYIKNIKSKC